MGFVFDMFWRYILPFLGLALLIKMIRTGWELAQNAGLAKELPLLDRYGRDSWALITGSTDGIGWAFAKALAHRGFNLILVARNEEKLKTTSAELKQLSPKVQIKTITKDFSKGGQDGFFEDLMNQVGTTDVSLLVNNVGQSQRHQVGEWTLDKIRDIVTVNCLAQASLLNAFLPRFEARKGWSGIIDVSSVNSLGPTKKDPLYTATKAFNSFLDLGLSTYVKSEKPNAKIDFLCLKPAMTISKMSNTVYPTYWVASAEDCVDGALRSMGHIAVTYGSTKHVKDSILMNTLYFLLPLRAAVTVRQWFREMNTQVDRTTENVVAEKKAKAQ